MTIKRRDSKGFGKVDGLTVARCNDPAARFTVEQIEAERVEPTRWEIFGSFMALFFERFDKEASKPLLDYYFTRINEAMGESEFRAAAHDAMGTELYFGNLLPFLLNHVQKQRENGPDLFALSVAEMMREADEGNK